MTKTLATLTVGASLALLAVGAGLVVGARKLRKAINI